MIHRGSCCQVRRILWPTVNPDRTTNTHKIGSNILSPKPARRTPEDQDHALGATHPAATALGAPALCLRPHVRREQREGEAEEHSMRRGLVGPRR